MTEDTTIPTDGDNRPAGPTPPPLGPIRKSPDSRHLVANLLSLCLGLFVLDAVVSLADDSLSLFFNREILSLVRAFTFVFSIIAAIVIYVLMGVTPMIPKRWFLPITLFKPAAALILFPISIFSYHSIPTVLWCISLCQVILGMSVVGLACGGLKFQWPLVPVDRLEPSRFSWKNLVIFFGVNVFVVPPVVIAYSVVCAALAVSHFSDGFVALRPGGLTVQARKYIRDDGKTIHLYPMSHVADSDFYQKVSESFPTNSIVLMEGVTDEKNLLTNKISYKRMAATLGLSEQHEKFVPSQGDAVRADVDVDVFTTNTISLLNIALMLHSKGVTPETLMALIQCPQPPQFQDQLLDDLVNKRNQHLLKEIRARLLESENIVVPWGALHMPGIAKELQKSGFRLVETRDYMVIRFHPGPTGKPM